MRKNSHQSKAIARLERADELRNPQLGSAATPQEEILHGIAEAILHVGDMLELIAVRLKGES